MSRLNAIQSAILELNGGAYHNLFDEYAYKKYDFENIHALGVQSATNKSTIGIPDSYVVNEDGTYTLLMYGTVQGSSYTKIKEDIESCLKEYKKEIERGEVKRIIVGYTSTNISPHQLDELNDLISEINIDFIGLSTLSHDLLLLYPRIALDHLNISVDSEQIFTPEEFIDRNDNNEMNTPLSVLFKSREVEKEKLYGMIGESKFTLVTGQSGVGKTKLVLEVCKRYGEDGYNILCVKNNGLGIHDDLRYYLDTPGEYLLFIDDINQTSNLEYILEFVTTPPIGVSIKIVATVRDYAKQQTETKLQNYFQYSRITIEPLDVDQIKTILVESLDIENDLYLERIGEISKGNIRLAILAGLTAKENGYPAISDASDIFKNYYGEILDSEKLSNKEVRVLFIVSLIQSIRLNKNKFVDILLKEFNISKEEFIEICHYLNENELLDLYYKEVVRINNQNFRDYILYYSLITNKFLSISRLLNIGFPKYKDKIVYALNTMTNLFPSEGNKQYMENQVNISWERAASENQREYLKRFYQLNEPRTLKMIKSIIDEMEQNIIELSDFEEPITNKNIRNEWINILGGFKHLEYFNEAIELLVYFFEKRLDLFPEIYAVFSTSYHYDEYSALLDYDKEYQLIKRLWGWAEYGENHYLNTLIMQLTREFLKCTFEIIKPENTNKSVQIIHGNLFYTEGSKKLRSFIWEILSNLYEQKRYRKQIHDILTTHYGGAINEEEYIKIFKFDLECIRENFIDKWDKPTLEQSIVLHTLKSNAIGLDISYPDVFDLYKTNEVFKIYHILTEDYIFQENSEAEELKEADLKSMIDGYTLQNFNKFFRLCNKIKNNFKEKNWSIRQSISTLFTIIENCNDYVDIIKIYLESNSPYYHDSFEKIINRLIHLIGADSTLDLLNDFNYEAKNQWISKFFELLPKEEVSLTYVAELLEFVLMQNNDKSPIITNMFHLKKYYKYDSKIIKKISQYIFEMDNKSQAVSQFLNNRLLEHEISIIMDLFSEDIRVLEDLYLLNDTGWFDYEGNLLIELVKNKTEFFDKFTRQLARNDNRSEYYSIKFEKIWMVENAFELIEMAFNNLIIDKYHFINSQWGGTIFSMKNNSDQKVKWIKKRIEKESTHLDEIKNIFYLIHEVLEYDTLEYILEFLKHNSDIDDFKQLPIYPLSHSFFGSEVPIYDKRIRLIQTLIENLEGIKFIEHIAYLKKQKEQQKKARKEVEIREYMSELN